MVLAWMGGREAKERQGNLGVSRLLRRTSRTGLTVGGLRGTGGLGRTLGDRCRLWGVWWSLPTIGLREEERKNCKSTIGLLFIHYYINLFTIVLTHSEGCLVLPGQSAAAWGMGMDWLTIVRTM